MVKAGIGLPQPRWTLRDWLAAAGLFIATAGVILWQNAHLAVLWDLSYVLDSAARIALGQMPYRDFPLAHAPLTFLIQAAIIRFTGYVYFHHILYVATVGGLGTVLTWRIALNTLQGRVAASWAVSLLLAAPLAVLGIYCIMPLPSYDCDCAFSILVAVWLLQSLTQVAGADSVPRKTIDPIHGLPRGFAAGTAICVPLFFKQNIGLPFLAATIAALLLSLCAGLLFRTKLLPEGADQSHALKGHGFSRTTNTAKSTRASAPEGRLPGSQTPILLATLLGAAATLMFAMLLLHFTVGLGNYFHWTIQFAAQRRLPGLQDMLGVYHDSSLLWSLPCVAAGLLLSRSHLAKMRWAQIAALALLAAPFLFTLASLLLYDDADERGDTLLALWPLLLILAAALALFNLYKHRNDLSIRPLLPFVLLSTINGAFMSQQLWGSTYAIWPLLILLIAEMIAFLATAKPPAAVSGNVPRTLALGMTVVISATLLICGSSYTASEERLSYAQFPEGPVQHSTFPQLAGMAVPGPYLPDFEELLRFASAHIPVEDGLIILPGEDPFYFVTGRAPQFPVLLFDPATDPYSPEQVVEEAQQHRIRWLIVKHELQIKEDPTPQREATLKLLLQDFTLSTRLHGYDVYRRQ
jgi:hypothetical protein